LLRHLARRPATAAAMTPGFWRLSVAPGIPRGDHLGVRLGINMRVLNRVACLFGRFGCGLIP
jgi:hypothetical protein